MQTFAVDKCLRFMIYLLRLLKDFLNHCLIIKFMSTYAKLI